LIVLVYGLDRKQVLKGHKVSLALKVLKAFKVLKEHKELQVFKAHKAE
jgi:hypothetical protein